MQATLVDSVSEALTALDKSPTFAMSLGAKELFHTNFIGFLLETTDLGLAELRKELRSLLGCPWQPNEETWCMVYRELSSLDLVIVPMSTCNSETAGESGERGNAPAVPSGSPVAVVEAKLKSLISEEQLLRYQKKLERGLDIRWESESGEATQRVKLRPRSQKSELPCRLVVLTPHGADVDVPGGQTWQGVSWKRLAIAIENSVKDECSSAMPPRLIEIVSDYANALNHVSCVIEATGAFYKSSRTCRYTQFLDGLVASELRSRRIADLVSKHAFSRWMGDLHSSLKTMDVSPTTLEPYVFYSRGMPGLGVELQFKTETTANAVLRVGVQIQAKDFRHYVAVSKNFDGLEKFVCESGFLDTWLKGSVAGLDGTPRLKALAGSEPSAEGAQIGRVTNLRAFDSERFVYSSVPLNDSRDSVAVVEEAVRQSMAQALKCVRGVHALMLGNGVLPC